MLRLLLIAAAASFALPSTQFVYCQLEELDLADAADAGPP
jgi:hypothetical protein